MGYVEWARDSEDARIARAVGLAREARSSRARCVGHGYSGERCGSTYGRYKSQCMSREGLVDTWCDFLDVVAAPLGVLGERSVDLAALFAGVTRSQADLIGAGFSAALFGGDDGVARAVAGYLRLYEKPEGGGPSVEAYDTLLGLGNRHLGLLSLCRYPAVRYGTDEAKATLVAGINAVCRLVERYGSDEHKLRALETFAKSEAAQGRTTSVVDVTRRYKKVERCVNTLALVP